MAFLCGEKWAGELVSWCTSETVGRLSAIRLPLAAVRRHIKSLPPSAAILPL